MQKVENYGQSQVDIMVSRQCYMTVAYMVADLHACAALAGRPVPVVRTRSHDDSGLQDSCKSGEFFGLVTLLVSITMGLQTWLAEVQVSKPDSKHFVQENLFFSLLGS